MRPARHRPIPDCGSRPERYHNAPGCCASSLTPPKAIDRPEEVGKVEEQLGEARKKAAKEGTPQPKVVPELEAPAEEDTARR
jgi:hypothetical protein